MGRDWKRAEPWLRHRAGPLPDRSSGMVSALVYTDEGTIAKRKGDRMFLYLSLCCLQRCATAKGAFLRGGSVITWLVR
jgi:hypothetical protein